MTSGRDHGCGRRESVMSRREMLTRGGAGFGALALNYLLSGEHLLAAPKKSVNPTLAKTRHHFGKAKSVIFLFMEGGPSHIDLFDPKPLLNKLAGQSLPPSFGKPVTAMGEVNAPLMECKRTWKRHGEGGLWISDWLPFTSQCADDLVVIRSCVQNGINHSGGMSQMNTGAVTGGRPSLGSWVTYGLGTENNDLPAFVVLTDSGSVVNGPRNWGAGFMPAAYQGIKLQAGATPIPNLDNPAGLDAARQQRKLGLLNELNQRHYEQRSDESELDARIRSYELAFRMQAEAPEAVDLKHETAETMEMYGFNRKECAEMARNCLLARRMVERGVRFVQVYHGAGSKWDSHTKLEVNHSRLCNAVDQPIAALLMDLKQRGLLEETLVLWGGEFGRTPMSEKGDGRDHNPTGFTMWMAGAGLTGGRTVGATDDLGLYATEDRIHVHDLHSTVLHLMGLDHEKVLYMHKGRPERIDMNEGHVATGIFG